MSHRFVGRAPHGTEWIAAAQAATAGARVSGVAHREIHLELRTAPSAAELLRLGALDDIFLTGRVLGAIPPTRDGLKILETCSLDLARLSEELRRYRPVTTRTFTVVASALGKRNYGRFELEETLGRAIARGSGFCYEDSRLGTPDSDRLSIRLHLGEKTFIGLRVFEHPLHRRAYRAQTGVGSLRPSLAHALGLLADAPPGGRFIDPFCGAGTIPIEAALGAVGLDVHGSDVAPEQIEIARQNATRAQAHVRFEVSDACNLRQEAGEVDAIVTNPPWQQQVPMVRREPSRSWLDPATRALARDGRLVVLTTAEAEVARELKQRGFHLMTFQVSLSGSYPHVLCASRQPRFFRATKLGANLERCLASYGKWSPNVATRSGQAS